MLHNISNVFQHFDTSVKNAIAFRAVYYRGPLQYEPHSGKYKNIPLYYIVFPLFEKRTAMPVHTDIL